MTWTSRSPAPGEGITALQMDIKITGVSREIMENALTQAKEARVAILGRMLEAIAEPRAELAETHRGSRRCRSTPSTSGWSSARAARRSARSRPTTRCRSTSRRTGRSSIYATDGHEGRRRDLGDHRPHEGARGRRHVHRQGRQDDRLRCVRRAQEGHRRPAARLERRPGPRQPHRGRDRPRRRARRARAGGRQGPRPDRAQARAEARERRVRLAGGARRAGEGRPAARAPRGAPAQ